MVGSENKVVFWHLDSEYGGYHGSLSQTVSIGFIEIYIWMAIFVCCSHSRNNIQLVDLGITQVSTTKG